MTIREALADARAKLKRLETPELDSEVILARVMAEPREYVLTHPEQNLNDEQAKIPEPGLVQHPKVSA